MQRWEIIENIRDRFDSSEKIEHLGLNFEEYQLLFRIQEGLKQSELESMLYCSRASIYRYKQGIIKKMKASTFEQAICLAAKFQII